MAETLGTERVAYRPRFQRLGANLSASGR